MSKRVVLVTGAARGVGAAVCRHFAKLGEEVVVNYNKSVEQAKALTDELSKISGAESFRADVSDARNVKDLFEFCMKQFGRIDVLVNNASYSFSGSWVQGFDAINWQEWQKTIDVDVKGTMLCSHAANQIMQKQGNGKIINFSSSAALYGDIPTYFYTAAKSAVVGITRAMARAFAPKVQVNCIAPGSVATDWIQNWKLTAEDLKMIEEESPLKRIGRPEEVAELVAFLASPTCTYITGQTILIDGGILLS